jgi:hypothetical protein
MAGLLLLGGLGVYTALLTWLAQGEVHGGSPRRVRTCVGLIAAIALAYVVLLISSAPAGLTAPTLVFGAYVLTRAAAVFAPVWAAPGQPAAIGRSIGGGILLMPAIDAVAVSAAGHPLAAGAVLLMGVPAQILKRRFAMS